MRHAYIAIVLVFGVFEKRAPGFMYQSRATVFFFCLFVFLFSFFSTEEKDGIQNMIKSNREKNARAIEDQSTGLFFQNPKTYDITY